MICPKCKTNNNYYHTYCYLCGNKLPLSDKKALPADEHSMQSTATQIVLNTEPNKKGRRSGAFSKKLLYFGLTILGVSFVIMATIVLSNIGDKQEPAYAPAVVTASPPPAQPTESVKLSIMEPKKLAIKTEQETYQLKIESEPAAKILVNGKEAAAFAAGIWTADVPLKLGENKIAIEAQCEGFLAATETVVITREAAPPKLLPDDSVLKETDQSSLTVTGTTEPNAVLSTSLPIVEEPTVDAQGQFKLVVQLPAIPGEYNLVMKAVAGGRETSTEQKVTRLWNEEAYSAAAEPVDYSDLVAQPQAWMGKVLDITGTVYSIESSAEGTTVFTLLVKGKRADKILVEYTGETKITRGVSRRIYCDMKEIKEGQPYLTARMAFKENNN